jgi:alkylhydroperoxidase family enzyme
VSAWRCTHATEKERARLDERIFTVPDPVRESTYFDEAAKHFDDEQLAALVLQVALINTWNRLNVVTRQIGGAWTGSVA